MEQPYSADIRKEVRFAVVLYGGVSLAIYISGVVRELLTMVQATAPESAHGASSLRDVAGNEASITFYRELASRLNQPDSGATKNVVYTRFVVDVIAGTSAGGLNGIYLAKALAHGQNLDTLRKFWIDKGDILNLLDVKDAAPRSVLSGDDMLGWLREAFLTMQPPIEPNGAERRAFVDDVQVVATTTDLSGLPVYLQTNDRKVAEVRYRNTYRFQFSKGTWRPPVDDFLGMDDVLALAARSTSSFPGAFAPARALDVSPPLSSEHIKFAYPDYFPPDGVATEYYDADGVTPVNSVFNPLTHAFADGGILNNKPFTHAIAALGSRRGGKPSDRKLVYVEPSPEVVSTAPGVGDSSSPDFFSVIKSGLTLPGEQSIRQDLDRVEERNRLIGRMSGILSDIPYEVQAHAQGVLRALTLLRDDRTTSGAEKVQIQRLLAMADRSNVAAAAKAFVESDVGDLVKLYGLGYAGYHRLKVASVTDDLTNLVTQLIGARPDSNDWFAARYFVRAWRDIHYAPYVNDTASESEKARLVKLRSAIGTPAPAVERALESRQSENAFLYDYDLSFGLRRLDYVLNKIDDLICMDERARLTLRAFGVPDDVPWIDQSRRDELTSLASGLGAIYSLLQWRVATLGHPVGVPLDMGKWQALLGAASGIPREQWPAIDQLPPSSNRQETPVAAPADVPTLGELASRLGVNKAARQVLMDLPESERDAAAARGVAESFDRFEDIAAELRKRVKEASILASRWAQKILPQGTGSRGPQVTGGAIARFFYDYFESVDRIAFPVFYQTDVGQETDVVSVVRISPDDCTSITGQHGNAQVHKLGGETYGHFGGFFAKEWRASDYLWGQLDGAERLVRAVCENSPLAAETDALVREAQIAILANPANVDGIALLENAKTAADRYQLLQKEWKSFSAPPVELGTTLTKTIASAVNILGKIVRAKTETPIGKIAHRLGAPVVWVTQTVVDENALYQFVLLATSLCVLSALLLATAAVDARNGLHGTVFSLSFFWLAIRIVSGVLILAVAALVQFIRMKIAAAIGNVIAPEPAQPTGG